MKTYIPYNGQIPSVDRETSREAAESMAPHITPLYRLILRFMLTTPSTCDNVEVSLGLTHQTASARIRELYLLGFIIGAGKRRTRSGRNALVWHIRDIEETQKLIN